MKKKAEILPSRIKALDKELKEKLKQIKNKKTNFDQRELTQIKLEAAACDKGFFQRYTDDTVIARMQ